MTLKDIAAIRLFNQQITATQFNTPRDVAAWMGAMQAQDYAMSKWAIGIRLPGLTSQLVGTALDNADLIRTHVLRPTWHLVSRDDIHWMLALTAPHIKAGAKSRLKELEITEQIIKKCNQLLKKELSGNKHLDRAEIASLLQKHKIATDENRLSHLLVCAELEGLICNGRSKGNKLTYALLDERVDKPKPISREAALERLAGRYFLSHGPATLPDFTWWSGLGIKDARNALEMIQKNFSASTVGTDTYWLSNSMPPVREDRTSAYLLPAFDEFIISYKNRNASLPDLHNKKAISTNGIFRPVVVVNGQVIGLWKRTVARNSYVIETELFKPVSKTTMNKIDRASGKYLEFLKG